MLVLARKRHESIKIGDEIVITITDVSRDVVRVGVEAPQTLRISRINNLPPAPKIGKKRRKRFKV